MLNPFCWPSKLTRNRRPKGRRTSVRDRNEFPLFPHHDFIPDYYSDTCQGNQTAYSLIFFYPSAIPSLLVLQSAMRTRTSVSFKECNINLCFLSFPSSVHIIHFSTSISDPILLLSRSSHVNKSYGSVEY